MGLRLDHLDDTQRLEAWARIIKRIYDEQVEHAWGHYMFRLVRAVFSTNPWLSAEGGFIFEWIVRNYVDANLMLLRRELDIQNNTENLRNLLLDICDHSTVITRASYLARWGPKQPVERWHANRAFDHFTLVKIAGHPDADYVDPDAIKADLDRVSAGAEELRQYAERTRAHRTPEAKFDPAVTTFGAVHQTLDSVREVIRKYYALITQGIIDRWEAVPQFNTIRPFERPWVTDPEAVKRAIDQEWPRH
jgi:hypothetical protein